MSAAEMSPYADTCQWLTGERGALSATEHVEGGQAMRRLGAGSATQYEGRIQRLWVRIGVIGCGHWGPHLIRNLNDMPEVDLVGVAEERQDRLRYVRRTFPTVSPFSDHRQLLASDVDAVVIA